MNTTLTKQFDIIDTDKLAHVEGGGKGNCQFVMAGSNGYACRYSNGEWGYIVTKSNVEATKDVIVNGWISSLGGGYFHSGYRG
ncbi:TPA: garvicin Q family class II bacteriocin [Streptococcus equi subsp. zooepidemicus]|uniref:Bacteriocin n=1 Tax=Streptococcus equi subsp. equi TaxID=148942 RepID=A0A380JS22_9STRE|nr:garvicin Q family class II bacteriocin [Streptococcus equi]MCD3412743.1 garvicin Q family class II bacteriocin [Streptococcus equi subsp. zooepidemicus]MCD3432089.1 garvicin Q family class II bacteriocin [Streptococcus equi subsp. zooepidemicus]MDI5989395.1 garvicin Q family class II bacteriocin [Streptococcus equi subsp. zooepidemicus]QGM24004.1 garvicin Q family class II bacteriocin [Streptococcus equi subsp. zooepidemicus]UFR16361.1 garvicin Q family class II bacteriocin [Streptococcus e